MLELINMLLAFFELIFMLIYLVGLLFIMLISVVYSAGYVYDFIFGKSLCKIGHFIGTRLPKLKESRLLSKLWRKILPKNIYLRYETPLFAYCFSYTAIMILTIIVPVSNEIGIILASCLYLFFYFVGMVRCCGKDKDYYNKVLDNNINFLKLSFLPLGFVITIVGFLSTITGYNLQEVQIDLETIGNWLSGFISINGTNVTMQLGKMIVLGIFLVLIFYIVSLPIQVIAYFIIVVINYFRKYREPYMGLIKNFWGIVKYMLRDIFRI